MARPRSAPDLYLLSKVSTLYYLRAQTQQRIAERLRISRPRVSRLLQEAQVHGIVQITVAPPVGLHTELESKLESRFGLEEALVVGADGGGGRGGAELRRQVGGAAAAYLARSVAPGETIGLAWGTTLDAMVRALTPIPTEGVHVVQTLGGIGPADATAYAASVVRRLAGLLGATPVLLPAPGVVASAAVRDALRDDPHLRPALSRLGAIDTLFVGVGSLASNPVLNDGASFPPGTVEELRAAGAVGDVALRFFDAAGQFVHTSLDDRLLGISAEQLRRVRRVVAVAGGAEKANAIHAALKAGILHVLITDQRTARELAARGR
ncbi:DNA-binding transcriptional regulator [Gemmatimonadetes bacterium T265]|nr:DNA-binding transcriptional regulator [Gemmatimonadetes bacterium T265]